MIDPEPESAGLVRQGQVRRIVDRDRLRRYLETDRTRNAYLLGDLIDPYWNDSAYFGYWAGTGDPLQDDEVPCAMLLRFSAIQPPPVLSIGDAAGVDAIYARLLAQGELTAIIYHAQPEHLDTVERYFYRFDAMDMWRMACTAERYTLPKTVGKARRLTQTDAQSSRIAVEVGLRDPESSRSAVSSAFDRGIFYGVEEAGELVAIAGTHIVAPTVGIGAVGFVFTYPEWRGRGYAQACTACVTRDLLELGCDLVVLNVRQDNAPAVRAYERLGYTIHNALHEGIGQRR